MKKIYRNLRDRMLDPAICVVSLDVFDTLLLRQTESELYRFAQVSRRQCEWVSSQGQSDLTPRDFLRARLHACEIAYRLENPSDVRREPHFKDILRLKSERLRLDPATVPHLLNIELDYEKTVLRPNRKLVGLAKEAKNIGKTIIFASDMYLPSTDIWALIVALAPDCPVDRGYSSADVGLGKSSGKLFEHICADLKIAPTAMLHIGDNRVSDYDRPRQMGINAVHLPRSRLWQMSRHARRKLYGQWLKWHGVL